MNLMNNENTIVKLVAQNFGYAKPNLSDIKKSIRHAQYKLAAAVRVCDAYYERTGERHNSYSKRGWETQDKVIDASKCLVAALGLEYNETIVRRLVEDAIVGEFCDFVRAQKEYRDEFRNSPLNDATKQAEVAMTNAYHNYQAALVVAMMQKEKVQTPQTEVERAEIQKQIGIMKNENTKFTPGPLHTKERCDGKWLVKDESHENVAICERGEGDANLYSAAPELLAALEEITEDWVDMYVNEFGTKEQAEEHGVIKKARAALSKAKGE